MGQREGKGEGGGSAECKEGGTTVRQTQKRRREGKGWPFHPSPDRRRSKQAKESAETSWAEEESGVGVRDSSDTH